MPGFAFDLTTNDPHDGLPWDFGTESKRDKARALLREQEPYLPIGSPMCTAFSQWQRLNAAKSTDKAALERTRAQAISHMRFVVSLYEEQVDGGRYFLHEHPLYADSWELECVRRFSAIPEVQRVHGDQCQFGAQIQSGNFKGHPTKKPTGFFTNAPKLAEVQHSDAQA